MKAYSCQVIFNNSSQKTAYCATLNEAVATLNKLTQSCPANTKINYLGIYQAKAVNGNYKMIKLFDVWLNKA